MDGKKKILIVDDEPDLRYAMNAKITANNYETVNAWDSVSAVSMAVKEQPDLIILDLGLPAGDGFIVMERFKNLAALAKIPVIVVTGQDPQTSRERALKAGAVAFFEKPTDYAGLLAAVRKTLGESQ